MAFIAVAVSATGWAQTHYSGDTGRAFGPVTDTCAFEFTLWTATAGGAQIGPVIERELRVRGGLYGVELDFGAAAFDGEARWLCRVPGMRTLRKCEAL